MPVEFSGGPKRPYKLYRDMIAALGGSDAHLSAVDMWSAGIVTTAVHLIQGVWVQYRQAGETSEGSFSAVSTPIFAIKASLELESSCRDLHNKAFLQVSDLKNIQIEIVNHPQIFCEMFD